MKKSYQGGAAGWVFMAFLVIACLLAAAALPSVLHYLRMGVLR